MSTESETITKPDEKTSFISEAILLMMSLLVLNQIIIDKFNFISKERVIRKVLNPPMITTTIGLIAGIVMNQINADATMEQIKKGFTQLFLIILLPPILYESAINMETKPFFRHFGTINLYAILGTMISIVVTSFMIWLAGIIGIATEFPIVVAFAYGSLISATDPVTVIGQLKSMKIDKMLNTLIFGESILNDAVSLTSYQIAIQIYTDVDKSIQYITLSFILGFIFAILIGLAIGAISAYILKKKSKNSQENIEEIESSLILIIPWVSYLIAEAFNLSGIVSIIFCGISMSRYAIPNLSPQGKKGVVKIYHSLAHNFENLIFLFIGIGLVGFELAWKQMGPGFFLTALITILIARFLNVISMSALANTVRNRNKISRNYQILLWFSGFRGAMAFALSLESTTIFKDNNYGNIMLTTTLLVVILNTYIQGSCLVPLINKLNLEQLGDGDDNQVEQSDGFFAKIKSSIGQFDEKVLQATLVNDNNEKDEVELQDQQPH